MKIKLVNRYYCDHGGLQCPGFFEFDDSEFFDEDICNPYTEDYGFTTPQEAWRDSVDSQFGEGIIEND